jgi:hypothetical protein
VWSNQRRIRSPMSFGFAGGPPPRDLLVLIGTLFVSYALLRMGVAELLYLSLTPQAITKGFLWQIVTYPFVAAPTESSLWFLFSLLMIFWFGRDAYRALGRRAFRINLAWGALTAAVVASLVELVSVLVGYAASPLAELSQRGDVPLPYPLLGGQYVLLTILIASFAVLYGNATIYFMFILPVRARHFLWVEILFAFMGYLDTHDLPGFLGLTAAVGIVYANLAMGGPRRALREWRLRLERRILEAKLRRARGRFKVVEKKDDDDVIRGPWVN